VISKVATKPVREGDALGMLEVGAMTGLVVGRGVTRIVSLSTESS
jgi:hypothetical protein